MKSTFVILLLAIGNFASAQKMEIGKVLRDADSVVILSHRYDEEKFTSVVDKDGKMRYQDMTLNPPVRLFHDDSMDITAIRERKRLDAEGIKEVGKLLKHQRPEKNGVYAKTATCCYTPRHTLLWYKHGKVSYVELCFMCDIYRFSEDHLDYVLKLDALPKIERFFREQGIRYYLYPKTSKD